ncbi:MAG: hypothetical protein ACLVD7_10175 [[Clostridium] leptum]
MNKKPKIGVIGFSDGEPEVHEELKGIVQEQMDAIVKALRASGEVDGRSGLSGAFSRGGEAQGQKMVAEDGTELFSPMACSAFLIFPLLPRNSERARFCWPQT